MVTLKQIQTLAGHRDVPAWVIKLVQDAVSEEREACAKLIESTDLGALKDDTKLQNWIAALLFSYAAAIRARSET